MEQEWKEDVVFLSKCHLLLILSSPSSLPKHTIEHIFDALLLSPISSSQVAQELAK